MIITSLANKNKTYNKYTKKNFIIKLLYIKKKYFHYFALLKTFIFIIFISLLFIKKNLENIQYTNREISIRDYYLHDFGRLKKLPKKKNHRLISKERHDLFKYISKITKRKISRINSIFLNKKENFGNQLIQLNKVIFFCEILKCERIILNEDIFWFIKNKIIDKEYNMTIEVGKEIDYRNKNIIIDYTNSFFWYFNVFEPRYRPEVIKKELLNNLPKIIVNPNDLYIYIRSGDIFVSFLKSYIQPPLCFYQELLNNYKFNKIYIISENTNNPVINKLLIQFPKIIFHKNSLKLDISYLIYAYNLVGGFSTFISSIIIYNDNLKSFWYFNFKLHYYFYIYYDFIFHHDVNIYKMMESDYYKQIKKCTTVECQKSFMLNYKCPNKILLIK